jgi:hypothetical protein
VSGGGRVIRREGDFSYVYRREAPLKINSCTDICEQTIGRSTRVFLFFYYLPDTNYDTAFRIVVDRP